MALGGYSVVVAPSALAQMEVALVWWKTNRNKAPELLAGELDAALALIDQVPQCGRRVANERLPGVRRLLLRRTGYYVDYQVLEPVREIRVVHFRHGRRRPS